MRSERLARHGSEGYWAGPRGDDGRAPGRNLLSGSGLAVAAGAAAAAVVADMSRGLFTPRAQSGDPRNAVASNPIISGADASTEPSSATKEMRMWMRHAIALVGLLGSHVRRRRAGFPHRRRCLGAQTRRGAAQARLDRVQRSWTGDAGDAATNLIAFDDWATASPGAEEIPVAVSRLHRADRHKAGEQHHAGPMVEKLYHVCGAGALSARPPAGRHRPVALRDAAVSREDRSGDQAQGASRRPTSIRSTTMQGTGNDNPERKWCTGRATLICIQSSYRLEGKIPLGIMLVNKLRDSAKKVSDHIDFQSELSALARRRRRSGRAAGTDRARYAGGRRARAEHFLRQSDHEVRQILRGIPGPSGRRQQDGGHRLHGARRSRPACSTRKATTRTCRCCAISCRRRC